MTKLEDIEKAVEQLSPEEMAKFRSWFEELQERLWDQQIENDVRSGKLDELAKEALADRRAGRTRELP